MALIKCRECEREISSEAKTCVHCGCKVKERKKLKKWQKYVVCVFSIVLAVVLIVTINNNMWKMKFSVKYVDYVTSESFFGDYYLYEITNKSYKTADSVEVVIRVEFASYSLEFEDSIVSDIRAGETFKYELRRQDIVDACKGTNLEDYLSSAIIDIVKIKWD